MATIAAPPTPPGLFLPDSKALDALRLEQSASPPLSSPGSRNDSVVSTEEVDHSEEIAILNTKLVNAINQQTVLDDGLQSARHELEIARKHIAQLEAEAKHHTDLVTRGLLVPKADVTRKEAQWNKTEAELRRSETQLRKELSTERELRIQFEKEKKAIDQEKRGIEQELESLTSALFQEANTMVSSARKDKEASDRKSEQLKNQLRDAELLLQSQQEQLHDLKAVVEKICSEHGEGDSNTVNSTSPSTPSTAPHERLSRMLDSTNQPSTSGTEELTPDHPLRFTHLIHPVLRTDILAYEDFQTLLKSARVNSQPPSRVASGSFGSINVMANSQGTNNSSSNSSTAAATTTTTTTSTGSPIPRDISGPPALKDTKVYKRALCEDIEPTLRLDIAPGVSWYAKRAILTSVAAGALVVEPMPPPVSKYRGPINACSLCGENRVGDAYARRHRFRTSETDESQRYPLCELCLGRVRATCDLVSFLRMVRDGHWRAETDDEVKAAWEENVRLREKMFWQRIGGGVVPAFTSVRDSPRSPTFPKSELRGEHTEDPFRQPDPDQVTIGGKIICKQTDQGNIGPSSEKTAGQSNTVASVASSTGSEETSKADSGGATSTAVDPPSQEGSGLSIEIPTASQ